MFKAKNIVIILILLTMLLMTACGQDNIEANQNTEEEVEEIHEPVAGGTLRVGLTQFDTLNPLLNQNRSLFQFYHLVYESLVTFGEDMDMEPLLAERWQVAADGQSIDFQLRDDVYWHDGEPFSGEDVIFTINLIKGNPQGIQGSSIYRMSVQQISDARMVDDHTLRVTFTRPFTNGLEVMSFPILPAHLFEGNDIEKFNGEGFPVVGTGAYQFEEYQTRRHMNLERNENYWGARPYIEKIEGKIAPDVESKLSLFDSREIDIIQPNTVDWTKYSDDRDARVFEFVSQNYEFVGFNFNNSLLQDIAVRRAVLYSVDRHKLIKELYLGHGTVVDAPVAPHSWLHDDNNLRYGFDIDTANLNLEEAGYVLSEEGVRTNESGTPLSFNLIINEDNVLRERSAEFIQESLEEIGMTITIEKLEWEEFNERVESGQFDLMIGGWELSYVPDLSFAFHSTQRDRANYINYHNEEMDDLLEAYFATSNRDAKAEAFSKVEAHIVDEVPYASLFYRNGALIAYDGVKGNIHPSNYNVYRNIAEWFIVEEE
ncbi:extracellular solute-binding protein, family 5 [Alkaliphilus metalliredigens QYMF]|uniref:Extracellular solute-binding protein, family 5 n=1 Tax=Alkaliphilus metalliredigens (strain QYMF) TaxID=293826 RepID=A6TSU3_ALKMQ|nr:peptide ABC transporter substrate-binding protein [Alkaliphilus metalliredigens]ABR49261.1 extracellular solute-binding protein, family 5 [Alkaliphilus metalliredigens QYMF]